MPQATRHLRRLVRAGTFSLLGGLVGCGNVVLELPGEVPVVDTGGDEGGEGTGAEPEPDIALSTSTVTATDILVGCSKQRSVNVRNRGDADLTVLDFELTIRQWDIIEPPELPLVIAPDESLDLQLRFTPEGPGDASGDLIISSDDPDEAEVRLALEGTGERPEEREELYYQLSEASADLLFAVDTSEGQEDLAEELSSGVHGMMNIFSTAGADVRVSAVVEDDGCVNGLLDYIDTSWSASDAVATMTTMTTPNGGERAAASAAFQLFLAAAEQADPEACNEELFEDGRQLHLVGLSRAAEGSAEPYAWYLEQYAAHGDTVFVHGIGGPFPAGCEDAEAYSGVYEASLETDGVFLSVCADLGANLSDLATEVVQRTLRRAFAVGGDPQDDEVTVIVDGEELQEGWTWEAEASEVRFEEEALPAIGTEIRIQWTEEPVCDE